MTADEKILVVADILGTIKMIYLNSGKVFENLFSFKMTIQMLKILPIKSPAVIVAADTENRLCFYYSEHFGKEVTKPP